MPIKHALSYVLNWCHESALLFEQADKISWINVKYIVKACQSVWNYGNFVEYVWFPAAPTSANFAYNDRNYLLRVRKKNVPTIIFYERL